MNKQIYWLLLFLPFCANHCFAQLPKCGTPDVDLSDPEIIRFNAIVQDYHQKTTMNVRVVPVAVHVIASNANSPGNITDAQIESQFPILNDAYRGVYGGVDTHVEFCLAGINREENALAANTDLTPAAETLLKGIVQEDPEVFLNVWLVESIANGTLGYSTFPKELATAPQLDGVVIQNKYWGNIGTAASSAPYDLGITAVHEFGHWLNLFHTFHNGCDDKWTCAFEGDCCCDTPPQKEPWYGCRERKNSCRDDDPDERDPVKNYMGYSDDDCMIEFTSCQSDRINLTLDSIRVSASVPENTDCPGFKKPVAIDPLRPFKFSVYPHPICEWSKIRLQVFTSGEFTIQIFDGLGRELALLVDHEKLSSGVHSFPLPSFSGFQFCTLVVSSGDGVQSKILFNSF